MLSIENNLVSIIIPTYNRAHLIGETLDSISAQTFRNWECIIVDDGSTDDTATLIANYIKKDIRFQKKIPNLSLGFCILSMLMLNTNFKSRRNIVKAMATYF